MTPLVSIIIPVFNGANYLTQAIDSALAQTYKNIEIIVVNDGSCDNGMTEAIATSYGNQIKYYFKTNGGVASALNVGIRNACGDLVSWLSHDDLYHSDKVERQIAFLESIQALNANIVVYSDYDAVDAQNNFMRNVQLTVPGGFTSKEAVIFLLFKSSIHGCSLLLPRCCFTEVGYFDENLRTTQDYDFWFKLVKHGYEFRHMPETLICSRVHVEQGTHALYKIAHREIEVLYVGAVDLFYEDIEKLPLQTIAELIVDLRQRKLRKTSNHLLAAIESCNKKLYRQLFKQYAGVLFRSKVGLMMAKPIQACKIVKNILIQRGRA